MGTTSQQLTNSSQHNPVLFMAGGTGGHVFPALACATALQKQGVPVHWLGTRNGLESFVIPNAKIDISYLPVSGLRGKGLVHWLRAPFVILYSLALAIGILRKIKPRVVVGMGGFASGPGGLAAWILRIPLIIHEQNAIPGTTNRILARLANHVLEGFPHTFAQKFAARCTGNPLRYDLMELPVPVPRKAHSPLRVLVLGGSQGAAALNETVPAAMAHIRHPVLVWHQVGRQAFAGPPAIDGERVMDYKVDTFIDHMGLAYAWADVVICRSGALTVSEVAQMGLPSLLIPFPHATDDHQTRNASFLADHGAAIVLPQAQLSAQQLAYWLDELHTHPERLGEMSVAARHCARPNAVQEIIELCLSPAR